MAAITQQTQQVVDYVQAFLDQVAEAEEETGDDINSQWQSEENHKAINDLLKKFAPKAKRSDKLKDPNKPKRGRSAYILFCADERPVAKSALDDGTPPTEVTSELGRRWKQLKESTKPADKKRHKKYEDASTADKKRYDDEMADYVPPSDEELELLAANKPKRGRKSTKKTTEEGKPKRGRSAYIFYCQDCRPVVKQEMGDAKATEVTTELGRRWTTVRDAGGDEYDKYVKLAEEDKARYASEMATWDGGEAVAKPAPKTKTTKKKAKPVSPKPVTLQEDGDADTEVEEDAFVDEPVKEPKVEPKAAVAKPAPKTKTTKKPATPQEDDDTEEDAFVDEPVKEPKVEPKAAVAKKSRKLPEFINNAKPTVKDAGFDVFAEECTEDALELLGPNATEAAFKKHVLKEWTALSAEDRAWYAKNAGK